MLLARDVNKQGVIRGSAGVVLWHQSWPRLSQSPRPPNAGYKESRPCPRPPSHNPRGRLLCTPMIEKLLARGESGGPQWGGGGPSRVLGVLRDGRRPAPGFPDPGACACWAFAAKPHCRARPWKCRGPEGPQEAWDERTSHFSSARMSVSILRSNALLPHNSGAKRHAMFLQPLVISRSRRAILICSPCLVVSECLNIIHTVLNNRLILPKKNALIEVSSSR